MATVSPFDLILQGAQDLMRTQMEEAGVASMEEVRAAALESFSQADIPIEDTPDSEAIDAFTYDARSEALGVWWKDARGGNGHEYVYYGVSPVIAQGLEEAGSRGEYMNYVIKAGFFPFTRLS